MPNPTETLRLISSRLIRGGTLRLMVYNGEARRWIRHLQRMFALLKIDRYSKADLTTARELLKLAAAESPVLANRLSQLGQQTMTNDARFVDTFLHPREISHGVTDWLTAITSQNLKIIGLFDRYAELDDLPNPLWHFPSTEDLADRALDGRFENNLELFITNSDNESDHTQDAVHRASPLWWFPYWLKAPPRLWFSYSETRELPWTLQVKIWRAHIAWLFARKLHGMDCLQASLSTLTMQRLVRVGAILPGQIVDPGRRAALCSPICNDVKPPSRLPATPFHNPRLHDKLAAILALKGRAEDKYCLGVMARLYQAQT